jgi:hypothetical protein
MTRITSPLTQDTRFTTALVATALLCISAIAMPSNPARSVSPRQEAGQQAQTAATTAPAAHHRAAA